MHDLTDQAVVLPALAQSIFVVSNAESAQTADDKITVSGNLDAILSDGARTIALSGVQFHFALPTGNTSAAPQPAQTDSVPENCVKV